jgi:hypothetical protein
MKLRVNLLKDAEKRYQGPVSIRFLLRTGGIGVGALLLIYAVLAIQGQYMLRRNLKAAQEEWTRIGPRYEEITKRQAVLNSYKTLLDELNQWGATNADAQLHRMLLQLQKQIPPSVQLLKVDVSSDWVFVKPEPPKPPPKPAKGEKKPKEKPKEGEKKPEKPVVKDLGAVPGREVRLLIAGRVTGELADEVVVQFTKTLHNSPGYAIMFDTMELQKLYREDTSRTGGGNWRQFEILGTAKPRMMP